MIMNELKLMPLLPFAMALAIGLIIGYFVQIPYFVLFALMGVCLILAVLARNKAQFRFVPLLLCTLCLGAALMKRQNANLMPIQTEAYTSVTVVVEDSPKMTEWGLLLSCIVVEDSSKKLEGKKIRCSWNEPQFLPVVGQTLEVNGKIRPTVSDVKKELTKTGNFNYERWLKSHSYVARMTAYGDNIIGDSVNRIGDVDFIERVGIKAKILRQKILNAFHDEGLEDENFAIVAAMGFGDKSSLTEATRDVFSRTGAAHLLALSGMHLGILYVLLSMLLSRLNIFFGNKFDAQFWGQIIVICTIWTYVVLVGMPQSVVRSAVMITLYAAISSSSRQKMSLNTLAVTAIVMLVVNPMSIWDVGFQMSFMAMVGIFVFHTPIYNIISIEWLFDHPFLRKIWALVCVSVAAQIGTMPLSVYYFGRIPVLFLLTNLVAIPLVTMLLYCVFLALVLWFVPFVRAIMLLSVQGLTWCLTKSLGLFANWDIVSINNISINWIQMMLIYMMIIVVAIMISRIRKIYNRRKTYSMLK